MENKRGAVSTALVIIVIIVLALMMGAIVYFLVQNIKSQLLINNGVANSITATNTIQNTVSNGASNEAGKSYTLSEYVEVVPYKLYEDTSTATIFKDYALKEVIFKNLQLDLVYEFMNSQIEGLASASQAAIDSYNMIEGSAKKEATSDISTEIKDGILSVRAYSNISVGEQPALLYNYLNIDLGTNKKATNAELINKFGYSKDKLAEAMASSLDQYSSFVIKTNPTESEKAYITNQGFLTKAYFVSLKPTFKTYIIEHINDFNMYVKGGEMYCDNFSLNLLTKLGYGAPTGGARMAEVIKLEK